MRSLSKPILWSLTLAVAIFVIAPLVVIMIASFGSGVFLTFPPDQWGTTYYRELMDDVTWQRSFLVSVRIALISTVVAVPIGILAALGLVRGRFRGKGVLLGLMLSPMIVPGVVSTLAIFLFLSKIGLFGSVSAIGVAVAVLNFPIVVVILTATLQGIDVRLEQAAVSLGASRLRAFILIAVPLMAPGILSAVLFNVLLAFDDLLLPLFLSAPGEEPLSVKIFNNLQINVDPVVAAVSTPLILGAVAVFLMSQVLQRRQAAK